MILGCGLSDVGARLYEQGFPYITNVDFSNVVIDYMRKKHEHFEDMDCKCAFLLNLFYAIDAQMDITEPNEIV